MVKAGDVIKEKKDKSHSQSIISWIFKNFNFIMIPGSRSKDLVLRERTYRRNLSKRSAINRIKSPITILGIVIIFIIVSIAVFQAWISPYTYEEATRYYLRGSSLPSPRHPLGTTHRGQDILARIIFGARASLIMVLSSSVFSIILGIPLGLIAAYLGGWLDTIIMRIMDIIMSFPGVIFAIAILIIWK